MDARFRAANREKMPSHMVSENENERVASTKTHGVVEDGRFRAAMSQLCARYVADVSLQLLGAPFETKDVWERRHKQAPRADLGTAQNRRPLWGNAERSCTPKQEKMNEHHRSETQDKRQESRMAW